MTPEECYRILEVSPSASLDEIQQVYRDLVQVWHPDRFGHSPRLRDKAEEKLKILNAAYLRLTTVPSAGSPATGKAADDRRRFPRAACELPLNHASAGRPFSSFQDRIADISAGGLFLRTREQLMVGERIALSFALPRFGELLDLAGVVVRRTPEGVGVRFRISARYQRLLAAIV